MLSSATAGSNNSAIVNPDSYIYTLSDFGNFIDELMNDESEYIKEFNVLNQDFAQGVQHWKTKHVYWTSSRRECLMFLYPRQSYRLQNSGVMKGQLYLSNICFLFD